MRGGNACATNPASLPLGAGLGDAGGGALKSLLKGPETQRPERPFLESSGDTGPLEALVREDQGERGASDADAAESGK